MLSYEAEKFVSLHPVGLVSGAFIGVFGAVPNRDEGIKGLDEPFNLILAVNIPWPLYRGLCI